MKDIAWKEPADVNLNADASVRKQTEKSSQKTPYERKSTAHIRGPLIPVESRDATQRTRGSILQMTSIAVCMIAGIAVVNTYYKGMAIKHTFAENARSQATNVIAAVKKAAIDKNFKEAEKIFGDVKVAFQKAVGDMHFILAASEGGFDTDSVYKKLVQLLTKNANIIAETGEKTTVFIDQVISIVQRAFTPVTGESLTEELQGAFTLLDEIIANTVIINSSLKDIPSGIIPEDKQGLIDNIRRLLDDGTAVLKKAQQHKDIALTLLGDKLPQRYLFLFQNRHEARPTGGFIGSIGIFDLNDGFLTRDNIMDVYDIDGQIVDPITPPKELQVLTTKWGLRDANISPDFAESAKNAAWLLEKGGGPSVDHVIAVDQQLLEEIMRVTGPLHVEGFNEPIAADDLEFILTYVVERKLEGQTTPKKILKKVYASLKEKMKDPRVMQKVVGVLANAMSEKRIQAYSFDTEVQNFFESQNVAGRIKKIDHKSDYFNVIAINVGGNKSDEYMEQFIDHTTVFTETGEVFNEVHITRKHTWSYAILEKWKNILKRNNLDENIPEHFQRILGSGENRAMMRVYVPADATLIAAEGGIEHSIETHYDPDLHLSYFYFPMHVLPQEEKTIKLLYRLPETLTYDGFASYYLSLQHQSAQESEFTKKMVFDRGIKPVTAYPENRFGQDTESGSLMANFTLKNDQHISVSLEKRY